MNPACPLFQIFGKHEASALFHEAAASPRQRKNYNLHQLPDTVQRFMNAFLPFSYVRPHRHSTPPKSETFVLLQGRVWVIVFDDGGKVVHAVLMDGKKITAVDIAPHCWHTIVPVRRSLMFEVKPGPYDPATDKEFAPWAPSEDEAHLHPATFRQWLHDGRKLSQRFPIGT